MAQCEHCKAHCIWRGSSYFPEHGCLVGYVPITNADRIRSMNDEELAKLFQVSGVCAKNKQDEWCDRHRDCRACWLNWLKQEAEE